MLNFPDAPTLGQPFAEGSYLWVWDGQKWMSGGIPAAILKYIVGCYVPGLMTANQQLIMHRVSKNIIFPANFGSVLGHFSQVRGATAATASVLVDVRRATSAAPLTFASIGTITIGPGSLLGTFTTSGGLPQPFDAGDTLSLAAPATPDATFANFTATLVGSEA